MTAKLSSFVSILERILGEHIRIPFTFKKIIVDDTFLFFKDEQETFFSLKLF